MQTVVPIRATAESLLSIDSSPACGHQLVRTRECVLANRSLLDVILEPDALTVLFQPILEYRAGQWHLHALECLVRGPKGTNLEPANVLFEYARRKHAEGLVDRACVRSE